MPLVHARSRDHSTSREKRDSGRRFRRTRLTLRQRAASPASAPSVKASSYMSIRLILEVSTRRVRRVHVISACAIVAPRRSLPLVFERATPLLFADTVFVQGKQELPACKHRCACGAVLSCMPKYAQTIIRPLFEHARRAFAVKVVAPCYGKAPLRRRRRDEAATALRPIRHSYSFPRSGDSTGLVNRHLVRCASQRRRHGVRAAAAAHISDARVDGLACEWP